MLKGEIFTDLSEQKKIEIDNFVKQNSTSGFFQSTQFFEVTNATKNQKAVYLIIHNQLGIEALMLVIRQTQFSMPVLNYLSARNIVLGGPVLRDNNLDTVSYLLDFYKKTFKKVVYTQIRNYEIRPWLIDVFNKFNFKYIHHLNIQIDLNKSIEELWKDVHSKRRNEIRKAIKLEVKIDDSNSDENLRESYLILQAVYKRAKLPLPPFEHFQQLQTQNNLHCIVSKYKGEVIATMFCIKFQTSIVDYYAGAYSKYYSLYPNDLLTWEVMLWGKKNGYTLFDFGGAGSPFTEYGVRDYKKKFGGTISEFGRYEFYHSKWVYGFVSFVFKLIQRFKS